MLVNTSGIKTWSLVGIYHKTAIKSEYANRVLLLLSMENVLLQDMDKLCVLYLPLCVWKLDTKEALEIGKIS